MPHIERLLCIEPPERQSAFLRGASARKLKRGRANLLGGRAWRYALHSFVSAEVKDLHVLTALNRGLIPGHYRDRAYENSRRAYVRDYLKEEVFDEGLTRNMPASSSKRRISEARGEQFGLALEHFILMEILARRSYKLLDHDVEFWRTSDGLDVDFVLARGEVAIEVKGASRADSSEFRSLKAFVEEHRPRRAIVVCNERTPRLHDGIHVLPWREFLLRLWAGEILA